MGTGRIYHSKGIIMLDHLIEPLRKPSDGLHNALILAITAPNNDRFAEAMEQVGRFASAVPDETVEKIKQNIETLLTDTADNAGE